MDSSFEKHFEESNKPFQTEAPGTHTSLVNVITQPNSRLSVLEKVGAQSPQIGQESAQQFVLINNEDGSLVMSPELHMGPTMLDMAAQTQTTNIKHTEDPKFDNSDNEQQLVLQPKIQN